MSNTLNADPAELAKFSELAHRWWDMDSEFRPLHMINPCGWTGFSPFLPCPASVRWTSAAAVAFWPTPWPAGVRTCWVLTCRPRRSKVAQLHALEAQTPNVAYREVSAEALAAEVPASFDVVTCMEMLEHVPDPASVVHACAQLVKPGGWVFFSTLNRNAKSFLFAIVGAEYVLNMLPRGTHEYAKMIRPSELAGYCRQAGLDVRQTSGMEYNPLTKRYSMSRDTSVNYLFATQRPLRRNQRDVFKMLQPSCLIWTVR